MDLQPGARVERFIVKSVLGKGGMATVYLIEHAELGTPYALKVIDLPSQVMRDRLLAEGKIQARLVHPNIVRVFDTTEVGGCPALILEHIDGPALDDMLEAGGFTLEEADHLAQGILRGVRAAQERGLIHRDLKPGNILLARTPEGLVPKIADFGLAKVGETVPAAVSHTRTGQVMGTPAYMAPEQFRSAKDVDGRADVWALGVVLYELVSGRRPFLGDDLFDLHAQVTSGVFPPLSSLVPAVPPRMEAAVHAALVVAPEARCPDAATLLALWRGHDLPSRPDARFRGATLQRAEQIATGRSGAAARATAGAATVPTASVPSEASRRPWWVAAGAVVGFAAATAGIVLFLGAAAAVWAGLASSGGEPGEPAADAPPEASVATGSVDAAPDPLPLATSDAPVPEQVERPVATGPTAAPRAPVPAPVPAPAPRPAPAAPTGEVSVTGEVDRVVLVASSGETWRPGAVPPGVYQVRATFSGQELTLLKPISVVAGQTTALHCVAGFKTCQPR